MLTIKTELLDGTTSDSETTTLRMITSIDGLGYTALGLEIELNSKTRNFEFTTVYNSLYGSDLSPKEFSSFSTHMGAYSITGIPNSAFDTEWVIKPYWITQDGTKVYGEPKITTINKEIPNGNYFTNN